MKKKILVVDDEKPIAEIIKYNLEKEGFLVSLAFDGEEAVRKALAETPDLIILDIMLPKKDGFVVCKEVRQKINVPIIMLTAREDEVDKVLGLELGADDYVTKPFSARELTARIKALIRRVEMKEGHKSYENILSYEQLRIDLSTLEVKKEGKNIDLTQREFTLLSFFMKNPGQVFNRENLLDKVWGYDYFGDDRTVDVTIRRLREKIEDDPSNPKYIITKRGIGYYLRRP